MVKCFFFSLCVFNILSLCFPLPTTANELYILRVSVYHDITVWALDNLLCVKIWRSSDIYKTEGSRSKTPVGKPLITNRWSVFPVGRNFNGLFFIFLLGWHQSSVRSLMTMTLRSSNQHQSWRFTFGHKKRAQTASNLYWSWIIANVTQLWSDVSLGKVSNHTKTISSDLYMATETLEQKLNGRYSVSGCNTPQWQQLGGRKEVMTNSSARSWWFKREEKTERVNTIWVHCHQVGNRNSFPE